MGLSSQLWLCRKGRRLQRGPSPPRRGRDGLSPRLGPDRPRGQPSPLPVPGPLPLPRLSRRVLPSPALSSPRCSQRSHTHPQQAGRPQQKLVVKAGRWGSRAKWGHSQGPSHPRQTGSQPGGGQGLQDALKHGQGGHSHQTDSQPSIPKPPAGHQDSGMRARARGEERAPPGVRGSGFQPGSSSLWLCDFGQTPCPLWS